MRPHLQSKRTKLTVRMGGHQFTIDEPPILAVTNLESVEVSVIGDLDVHGFFGLDPEVRPGFQSIGVKVCLNGPESRERYAALTKAVDEHCPVHACPPSAEFTSVSVTSGG